MPTYLCHGFRWERQALRGWVAINDIDDGAPDWIIAPRSAEAMLRSIAQNHPYIPFGPEWRADEVEEEGESSMDLTAPDGEADKAASSHSDQSPPAAAECQQASLSVLDAPIRLLEEYHYDENALDVATPPFAYVADYAVQVETGVNVADEMRKYESLPKKGEEGWFEKLMVDIRLFGEDTLGLGWYVVVCDDEVRDMGLGYDEDEGEGTILEESEEEEEGEDKKAAEENGDELDQSRGLKSRLKQMVPLRKKAQDSKASEKSMLQTEAV